MWSRHPVLLGWWLAMFAMFGLGWMIKSELFLIVPFFAAMIIAVITYRCVKPGVLVRRGLYYVLVASLVASSATVAVAAGSTLVIVADHSLPIVGFLVLGAANLLIVIVSWRAILNPTPKRAALAGMLAVLLELFAMVFDVLMNHRVPEFNRKSVWTLIVLFGSIVSMGTGALACIAAVASFDTPHEHEIPVARVVDEDAKP